MKKIIYLLLVSFSLVFCTAKEKKTDSPSVDWTTGTVEAYNTAHVLFYSKSAKSDVSFHIFLPDDYLSDTTQRFPVIYWLHGSGASTKGIMPLTKIFNGAISRGLIPPLIIVFPNGLPYGMWCNSKDGKQPVEDMFIKDLIPYVDSAYRTVASASGRIAEGFSMGGYGAGRFAFKYHNLFGGFSIIAGGPLQTDFSNVAPQNRYIQPFVFAEVYSDDMECFKSQSPFTLAEQLGKEFPKYRHLRIIVGKDDFVYRENLSFHKHLTTLGIKHQYYEFDNIDHRVPPLIRAMGDKYWEFYNEVFK